jgi:carbon monoxide dehydrogenase subunit G
LEITLDKRYPIDASREQAWGVLSDIHATAACMPGAQITEQVDDTHYKGTVKSKVGPAVMTFNGDIELLGRDAGRHAIELLGKGADRGGSSAAMKLSAHLEPGDTDAQCVLVGQATVTVSGKLAQFGNRLLVPVSDAMLGQFADNFRAAAAAVPAPGAATAPAGSADAGVAAAAGPQAGAESQGEAAAPAVRPPAAVKELNALALMWTVIKGWFAGLFGKRS